MVCRAVKWLHFPSSDFLGFVWVPVWNAVESRGNVGRQNLEVHRAWCHTELQFCHSLVSPRAQADTLQPILSMGKVMVNCFYCCQHREGAVVFISAAGTPPELGRICFLNCSCFEAALVAATKWHSDILVVYFVGFVWNESKGVKLFLPLQSQ